MGGEYELMNPPPPPNTRFDNGRLSVSFGPWATVGRDHVQTSAPYRPFYQPPAEGGGSAGTSLDFSGIDCVWYMLSAELKLKHGFSLGAEYGFAGVDDGPGYIHDWYSRPGGDLYFTPSPNPTVWHNPDMRDYSAVRAKLDGSSKIASAAVYYRLLYHTVDTFGYRRGLGTLDLFVGYSGYSDSLHLTNGSQLLSDQPDTKSPPYKPPTEVGPISGMNSHYNVRWEGMKIGARERLIIRPRWSLYGTISWWPGMKYTGEGYWNWRTNGAQNVLYTADGTQIDYMVSLSYAYSRRVSFEAGYRGIEWYSRSGTGTIRNTDGTVYAVNVDSAQSSRKGWFFHITIRGG